MESKDQNNADSLERRMLDIFIVAPIIAKYQRRITLTSDEHQLLLRWLDERPIHRHWFSEMELAGDFKEKMRTFKSFQRSSKKALPRLRSKMQHILHDIKTRNRARAAMLV